MAPRPHLLLAASAAALLAGGALAQQDRGVSYTFYGTPGLLEMPSAVSASEGALAGTVAGFGGQLRTSFTFQVTPRFSATFRYGNIRDYQGNGEAFYDRSFDLRYRFNDEGDWMPSVALGLQDFLGTGIYSGEYVVATKTLGDSVRVTAGLGWGRLGSYGGFDNPLGLLDPSFDTRPDVFDEGGDTGGLPGVEAWFRGDAALFGGVEWAATDRLTVKVEYSSDDAYATLDGTPLFDRASPLNFGAVWRPLPGIQLQGAWMYGTTLAFGATVQVNANDRPFWSGLDAPPQPVAIRPEALRAALTWDRAALPEASLRDRLARALRAEGVVLDALEVTDRAARVRYTNTRFRSEAQALGRVARILTRELPPSVETLTLEPAQRGVPLSAVSFARSDLERLENEPGGTAAILQAARIEGAAPDGALVPVPDPRPRLSWGVRPYVALTTFDGDQPVKLSLGLQADASYRLADGLVLSGVVRQELLDTTRVEPEEITDPDVPVVRRNAALYGQDGPSITRLQLAWYGRTGREVFTRVTAGYLETQYAGLSTEVLWAPPRSRWALGAELSYVRQRDWENLLGFRDYEVLTGLASLYWDLGNGFQTQVDAGRYLAGDWGATLAVDRRFENGWRVGAYATLTDIPFEQFGEGSFDKGIRLSVPVDAILGRPTRRALTTTLSSLNRDGGARLEVEGRLYDVVRGGLYPDLEDSWGRFWR